MEYYIRNYPTPDDPEEPEEEPAEAPENRSEYGHVTDPHDSPENKAMSDFYHAQQEARKTK